MAKRLYKVERLELSSDKVFFWIQLRGFDKGDLELIGEGGK